jgi:haloalkane dehalogenase
MPYLIHVRGHIDPQWSEWLDGLTITHNPDGTSQLYGEVRDQAALYGLTVRLRDLGLDLISLQPVPSSADTELDPDAH